MTRHPFDSSELDRTDPDLDSIGERLDRYAAETSGEPSMDLAARIAAAVAAEPAPRRSIMALVAAWGAPTKAFAAAAVVLLLVTGAVAVAQFTDQLRDQVGATPQPSIIVSPSPSLSPTPTTSPTPSASPTPSPTPTTSPTPTATPSPSPTALPTASDDGGVATPEPSASDNSGPGGGGGGGDGSGDSSGPGSGGDGAE